MLFSINKKKLLLTHQEVKKMSDDKCSRLDTMPAYERQTDGQKDGRTDGIPVSKDAYRT